MKKRIPNAPLVTVRPPKKPGLLRKAARLGATVVAARVAAGTGGKGIVGLVAGAGAKRIIMRYPVGALFVAGAYLAGRIFETNREAKAKREVKALTDQRAGDVKPDPLTSAHPEANVAKTPDVA